MSKNLSRIVALLFLAFASAGPSANGLLAQDQRQDVELRQTVDKECEEFLQKMLLEEHFTGVALVMKAGKVVHAKGYGNASEGTKNSLNTVFHVASITKQFTAAATLQLVEAGKINLETPINEYLPEQYRSDHWKTVTCKHLLSHSSGIEDYGVERDYYNVVDGFCLGNTVDGMIREAMQKPLRFEPGAKFEYSNIGFTLLGEIIEKQTLLSFDEYVKRRILKPMGMNSSRVHVIGHVATANEASGYRWNAEHKQHLKDEVVTLPVTAPDGGLITTLSDFTKWISVYTDPNPRVISKDSVRAMTTRKVSMPKEDARGGAIGYGYGLFVEDEILSHTGYIVGFRSHFILDRDNDLLVVVFSNNTTNEPERIAQGLLEIADAKSNIAQANDRYHPGFSWNRLADFDRGKRSRIGSEKGNPNTDANGSGVWQYEGTVTRGGPLKSDNSWYRGETRKMGWNFLYGAGQGGWISPTSMYCSIDDTFVVSYIRKGHKRSDSIPIVRWMNPLSRSFAMRISGGFELDSPRVSPVDVEFVLVHWDASEKKHRELFSITVSNRPSSKHKFDEHLKLDLKKVVIEPRDQIVYSFRSRELHDSASYIDARDNITFSIESFRDDENEAGAGQK